MATKILEAQRARALAAGNYNEARWMRDDDLMKACAKSMNAFQEIRRMTDYYNNQLNNGKWKHTMCFNPRDLYVFYAPNLPIAPTDEEIAMYTSLPNKKSKALSEVANDSCIVLNASSYTRASDGIFSIQSLGHSMNSVSLPKGKSITFDIDSNIEGEVVLRTAVIPTHPNDTGDIRFSVRMNNEPEQTCSFKEGFRTESWKENVLRGQAIRNTNHSIKKGKQSITITALDNHVLIDQLMIDLKPNRKFYVYPIEAAY